MSPSVDFLVCLLTFSSIFNSTQANSLPSLHRYDDNILPRLLDPERRSQRVQVTRRRIFRPQIPSPLRNIYRKCISLSISVFLFEYTSWKVLLHVTINKKIVNIRETYAIECRRMAMSEHSHLTQRKRPSPTLRRRLKPRP